MMLRPDYRLFPALAAATIVAYPAGEQLRYSEPSPAPSRVSPASRPPAARAAFRRSCSTPQPLQRSTMPPPLVPPGDRQQQG